MKRLVNLEGIKSLKSWKSLKSLKSLKSIEILKILKILKILMQKINTWGRNTMQSATRMVCVLSRNTSLKPLQNHYLTITFTLLVFLMAFSGNVWGIKTC